ncbi:MAG TPA: tetratricopeptide repeat protein, partial [Actinomycetota bacterium]
EGTEAGAFWVGEAKGRIGAVYRLMNRLDEADRYLEPALRWFRKLGATLGAAANMKLMADVAFRRGDHKRAVHLIAFSEAVDDRMGGGPPKELMLVAIGGDQIRAAAAEQVDHETVERWWAEGSAMDVDEAIAYALGENT